MPTGHSTIDAQHELNALVGKLADVCTVGHMTEGSCQHCTADMQLACSRRLDTLIGELMGFMVEHFAYEEQLMQMLPATEGCLHHIEKHKLAHEEISRRLSEMTLGLENKNPSAGALRLQNIVGEWMGVHTQDLDTDLSSELEKAYEKEFDYDAELACLLNHGEKSSS